MESEAGQQQLWVSVANMAVLYSETGISERQTHQLNRTLHTNVVQGVMEQGYLTGHTAYWSQICLSTLRVRFVPRNPGKLLFPQDLNLIDVKWRNFVIMQRATWSSGCGCITGKGQRYQLGWTHTHFSAESDLWLGCLGDSRSWPSLLSLYRTLPKALTVLKHAQSPWWKNIMLPGSLPWPLDSWASAECSKITETTSPGFWVNHSYSVFLTLMANGISSMHERMDRAFLKDKV